jgi:hypothetical protein
MVDGDSVSGEIRARRRRDPVAEDDGSMEDSLFQDDVELVEGTISMAGAHSRTAAATAASESSGAMSRPSHTATSASSAGLAAPASEHGTAPSWTVARVSPATSDPDRPSRCWMGATLKATFHPRRVPFRPADAKRAR